MIAEHDHLLATFHRVRCGKQDRSAVQSFAANPPAEIAVPRQELLAEHVHLQLIEPELERVAIHDSYACRKGSYNPGASRR